MANAKAFYSYLDSVFPSSLSCSWDNDGAMCMSDPERAIKRVLLTLDVTVESVDYAVQNDFDAIVSHHPLIFTPMRSINGCDVKSRIITKLMRSGISAFSFHTRLDAVMGGVNDCLCEIIGVDSVQPFVYGNESLARIGKVTPMTSQELAAKVKKALSSDCVTYTCKNKIIQTVVVVGGSGKDFIDPALDSFADALITGEVSYNASVDASDSGLCIITAGHFYTENPVLPFLEKKVIEFDPTIEIEHFHSNLIQHI